MAGEYEYFRQINLLGYSGGCATFLYNKTKKENESIQVPKIHYF